MSFFEIFKTFINSLSEIFPLSGNAQCRIAEMIYYPVGANAAIHFPAALADLGAAAAVIYVFRKKINLLLKAFWGMLTKKTVNGEDKKEIYMLLIATCPILAAAVLRGAFEVFASNPAVFIAALAASGGMLFASDKVKRGETSAFGAPLPDALIIGTFRLLGFIPGLSGTGAAIFGGALSGFSADFNCEFAFLTLIPALLGKCVYNLTFFKASELNMPAVSTAILIGIAVFAAGIIGIKKARDLIFSGKLRIFSYILWAEAVLVIILSLRG